MPDSGDVPAWVDLPASGEPVLTDVLGGALACLDGMPLGDEGARQRLGLEWVDARQLLVILVDGLGYSLLEENLAHAPTLRSFRSSIARIHTIAPSTTAAAISAFGTGERPGATRMVGYSVAHCGRAMNLLAFEGGPPPEAWQECAPYFERLHAVGIESVVISPHSFASSGLTRAALRGARHVGAMSWEQRCQAALRELKAGTRLVYLYWSDIDHVGHSHGSTSRAWTDALEVFDGGLGRLLSELPYGVMTVMTADHGMVDIDQAHVKDLASTPALARDVRLIAGETRAVHVHAEPGCAQAVCERWSEELGEDAWVIPQAGAAPILGQGPGLDEIGDAIVFMGGRCGVVDSRVQSEQMITMPGVHGSLTSQEMGIPLVRLS